jgi:hypothetical protein
MNNRCCCELLLELALGDVGEEKDKAIEYLAKHFVDVQGELHAHSIGDESGLVMERTSAEGCNFCGALASALAILYSVKDHEDAADHQDELMDWFTRHFGGYDCEAVEAKLNVPKDELCPKIILATYLKLRNYIDPDNHLSQKSLI